MLLEKYIRYKLRESIDSNKLSYISQTLEKSCQECIDQWGGDPRRPGAVDYHMSNCVLRAIYKLNLDSLGSGESREAYDVPGEDWVIKVAKDSYGAKIIKQEVEISEGVHGQGARDIFVKVYDYDRLNDKPYWMICEKVEVLHDFEDFEALKRIFPTFYDAIKDEDPHKNFLSSFKSFISDTLFDMVNMSQSHSLRDKKRKYDEYMQLEKEIADEYRKELDISLTSKGEPDYSRYNELQKKAFDEREKMTRPQAGKEHFYRAMISAWPREKNIKPIEEIRFGKDFKRIARAFAYIKSDDLHDENLGIIPSSVPSPKDFVILDFML